MLIVAGREYPTKCPSKTWRETGMEFRSDRPGSKPRRSRITLAVVHWTGGEGSAKGLFAVLNQRELGVEFGIERDGTIVQFCDPALVDTFDAGVVNARSWGVEVINGAIAPLAAKDRPVQKATIHGVDMMIADFYPAQIAALRELLEIVNGALGIPMRVPRDAYGALSTTVVPPEKLAVFTGVVGHYHVTRSKQDPGSQVFWDLARAGVQWG